MVRTTFPQNYAFISSLPEPILNPVTVRAMYPQMKVLIVDDNQTVRALLRDYLPESVDEVHECEDGLNALPLFRRHLPDWVLMDWEMPRLNGIDAIRRIIAEFPDARICMVTAFADSEIRHEALAVGARGFVLKDNLFELEDILSQS